MPFKDRVSPGKRQFAKRMYENPTESEAALWERLRNSQLGVGFLCQEVVLGYIADFYCPAARLVVEVDGPVHQTAPKRAGDARRDRALRWRGLVVLHLSTEMTTDEMIERIDRKLLFLQVKRRPTAA